MGVLPSAISELVDGCVIHELQRRDVTGGRDPELRIAGDEHRRYLAELWAENAARWHDEHEGGSP
jgi:hypothetical protein